MKAVLCPVCNGAGKVELDSGGTVGLRYQPCHGCGGKGWVEVHEEVTYYPEYPCEYPYTYPYYSPYPDNPWITIREEDYGAGKTF